MESRFDKYLTDDDRALVEAALAQEKLSRVRSIERAIRERAMAGYAQEILAAEAASEGRSEDADIANVAVAKIADELVDNEVELTTGKRPVPSPAPDPAVDVEPTLPPIEQVKGRA